jgi:hypothetical protein
MPPPCPAAPPLLLALAAALAPLAAALPAPAAEAAAEAVRELSPHISPEIRAASAAALPDMPAPPPARPGEDGADPEAAARLFAMPEAAAIVRAATEAFLAGAPEEATRLLDAGIARLPFLGELRAGRAVLAMLAGEPEAALGQLEPALAGGGVRLSEIAADPVLGPLVADPAAAARLEAAASAAPPPAPPPVPAPVAAGRAPVGARNTAWNPGAERLEPRLAFPPAPEAPVLPARRTAANEMLRELVEAGRAAGNHGDLYDNRDRGHSALEPEAHPQLAHVAYSAAAREAGVDYGLAGPFLFDRPVIGNSSTAFTAGPYWRSQPRHAMTLPDGTGPMRLWQAAHADHLYVYPAHKDFGEAEGDVFPANTPYILVSRGSSGSDRAILEAAATILAAFRPDTKARLVEENLVVPTMQMVFRRSLRNVLSREDYFGGAAHPAAFEGFEINLARMVSLANSIAPDAIPAEARIAVVEEELGVEGIDFFGRGLGEQLFDTPQAVARVWRSKAGRRSMIVSAEASRDPNGRPLEFHWRLLQGDPEKVAIEPLGDGSRARVTLDWHDPFEISEDTPLETARVDIGVFADNGAHDSAPAMLSWYFPPNQARRYETGPDGAPRIAEIDHAGPEAAGRYADPLLAPRADWRDVYQWGPEGTLLGWTRHRGAHSEAFTAGGARVLAPAADGRPARTATVAYPAVEAPGGGWRIEERDAALP